MNIAFTSSRKFRLLLFLSAGIAATCLLQAEPSGTETAGYRRDYCDYIETYCKTAIRQQKKYKIPASIILAQAILESSAGQSYLALGGNNHFGIKCNDWNGLCIQKNHADGSACYRKYLAAADSYEDHSLFLTGRNRYDPLFKLPATDYKNWAKGLKQYGYATDPQYASKLIALIETYELYRFDTASENDEIPFVIKNRDAAKKTSRPLPASKRKPPHSENNCP
ncbi:MAG: glucosaminidase domain-containing protein [Tannerella sp.]|jgi:flagellum-specific peptidoglycan hydrolase FlgJ|nr:glucosaminidase domain-containing protein [Tannerella sp.]